MHAYNLQVNLTMPFVQGAIKIISLMPDIIMKQLFSKSTAETHVISSIYNSEFRYTIVCDDHNQPLRKPARRNPETIYGHARINRQINSER